MFRNGPMHHAATIADPIYSHASCWKGIKTLRICLYFDKIDIHVAVCTCRCYRPKKMVTELSNENDGSEGLKLSMICICLVVCEDFQIKY